MKYSPDRTLNSVGYHLIKSNNIFTSHFKSLGDIESFSSLTTTKALYKVATIRKMESKVCADILNIVRFF